MSKSRRLGFTAYQPTDDAFYDLFAQLRADRLIPDGEHRRHRERSEATQCGATFVCRGAALDCFAPLAKTATDQAAFRSVPHHSATNRAIAVVQRFTEARLTRSSKAWMFWEIGP